MSFTLGGPGPFLPKKSGDAGRGVKSAAQSRAASNAEPQAGSVGVQVPPSAPSPGQVVQTSQPAFDEPGIKVRATMEGQVTKFPIDTPGNVIKLGDRRRSRSLSEQVQTILAKSAGVALPAQNIDTGGSQAPRLYADHLATLRFATFVIEAARCKRGLLYPRYGLHDTLPATVVKNLPRALQYGDPAGYPNPAAAAAAIVAFRNEYYSLFGTCVTPLSQRSRTTVVRKPDVLAIPSTASAGGSPDTGASTSTHTGPKVAAGASICSAVFVLEAAKCGRGIELQKGRVLSPEEVLKLGGRAEATISEAVAAGAATDKDVSRCVDAYYAQYGSCKTKPALPPASSTPPTDTSPAPPFVPSGGGGSGGGGGGGGLLIADVIGGGGGSGGSGGDEDTSSKKGLSIWWLVALIGGGLLIKKLAATKVVGAAVAGVPLVAEMGDEDEAEEPEHEDTPESAEKDEE